MRSTVARLQRDTPQDPGPFRRALVISLGLLLSATGLVLGAPAASANASVTLYVSTAGSSTSGCTASGAGACKTIQEGVTAAEAYSSSAVTVMVAAGTYDENDTIDVPSGDTLTLQGAGASVTTADGGGAGPVFTVSSGTAAIDDLSITDGSGAGAPGEVNGGGVDNTGGTVTLTGDTLSNNAVLDYGGAVSNGVGATVTLTDDTLVGNSAFGGGGIYNKEGTAILTNDTLSSDSAVWGGALYNYLSPANATLTDDTLSNDTGTTGPGGIYNDGNAPTISDSVLDGAPCEGSITDGGYNVESDDSCGFGSTSVVNSSNIDLATSLAANGSSGPETLAIGTDSSAYAEVPIANCTVTTDERGAPRPGVPGPGARCDAGAFEYTSLRGVARRGGQYRSQQQRLPGQPVGCVLGGCRLRTLHAGGSYARLVRVGLGHHDAGCAVGPARRRPDGGGAGQPGCDRGWPRGRLGEPQRHGVRLRSGDPRRRFLHSVSRAVRAVSVVGCPRRLGDPRDPQRRGLSTSAHGLYQRHRDRPG